MKPFRYAVVALLLMTTLFVQGQTDTDSLLRIVQEHRRDTAEARALNELASAVLRTDMQQAKAYYLLSAEISRSGHFIRPLSNSYARLTNLYGDMGLADSGKYYLTLLKKIAEADPYLRANYVQAAGLFYKGQNKLKEALPFQLEAVSLARADVKTDSSVRNLTALAGALLNVGNTYNSMGDYHAAIRHHLDALRIFEAVGNKRGISFCYNSVGTDFLHLRQLHEAGVYLRQSLALKEELKDQRGSAITMKEMGDVYYYSLNLDSAMYYYDRAEKIYRQMGLKKDVIDLYIDKADCYRDAGFKDSARAYYEKGKEMAQAIGDAARLEIFNAGLTALQPSAASDKDTEKKLLTALQHSIDKGDKDLELKNYQYLADYYARTGQGDKTETFIKHYYDATDSLESMRVQTQMKKLEGQYNVERKEHEIALLKKDQQLSRLELQKQKAFQYGAMVLILLLVLIGWLVINRYRIVHRSRRAIEIEKMRNRIARDLHDDVGSTLTSINIMSKVALQTPGPQEEAQQAVFQKIKDRTSAIIEKMDDIVWTIHPQNDTMERLLFRMKEFAAEILEPSGINYDFDEKGDLASLKLDVQKRKDLYLLFKEAINNAAKYSECRNLRIRLWREKDSLQMEIVDDGRGFVEADVREGHGLGSMRERAASMVAKIHIKSAIGEGTHIALDMPIS
ncbi:MAG TPA: sensor histidine kinase [Puia sp.]|nr:sensor histidine kinase [Puia sp.]